MYYFPCLSFAFKYILAPGNLALIIVKIHV